MLRGARMRMARKPSAVARELLRNFPKPGSKRRRRRKPKGNGANGEAKPQREELESVEAKASESDGGSADVNETGDEGEEPPPTAIPTPDSARRVYGPPIEA